MAFHMPGQVCKVQFRVVQGLGFRADPAFSFRQKILSLIRVWHTCSHIECLAFFSSDWLADPAPVAPKSELNAIKP